MVGLSKQERIRKPRTHVPMNTRTEVMGDVRTKRQDQKDRKELEAELDALLEDIDAVLEENAETFIAGYVQKGGQ